MDIGAAHNDTEREATYRFLNAEISEQHRMLMEEAHALDTKATVVAGVAAAAVSFLLAHRRHTIWWLALVGYLLALAFALGALWPAARPVSMTATPARRGRRPYSGWRA